MPCCGKNQLTIKNIVNKTTTNSQVYRFNYYDKNIFQHYHYGISLNENIKQVQRAMRPWYTNNNDWGPRVWCWMHKTALILDESAPDLDKDLEWIKSLSKVIPCDECRIEMENYIENYDIIHGELFLFTYNLHAHVNNKLGKYNAPFELVKQFFLYKIK